MGGQLRRLEVLDSSGPQVRLTHSNDTEYSDLSTKSRGDHCIFPYEKGTQRNVGINTINPEATLEVNGVIAASRMLIKTEKETIDLLATIATLQKELDLLKQLVCANSDIEN